MKKIFDWLMRLFWREHWKRIGNLDYLQLGIQEYNNCSFSAGLVRNHPVDTLYLRIAKKNWEPITLLLRPDEAAAIAWVLTGVLWSDAIGKLE